ncbi:tRNA (N6-isopentenyl adenosine(37)-C2)-methylthiotransferase MiaB [Defluviitalea phaphyphila]|uniref:tRNA (N6-isopentenyl adenosine(37)-C2)-methylthiotransferase MiaB n=1 Tax=Defluviitalea phaphyphila TaxID=1473580 RepID=UPI000730CF09|nr:tRNA (N6-isopentenyl adenosine(37)-C2)-methylthiotransferase MiaB [Defluviitalea phaphyphila]
MSKRESLEEVSVDETVRQQEIIKQLSLIFKGKGLKYFIQTFGCQMNAHDSEKLEGMLKQIGYEKADKEKEADFIIYNTCCVRENAEQKVYGKLGYLKTLKEKNKNLIIAICGCMMQQESVLKTIKTKYNHVDIIFGTFNLYKMPELFQTYLETREMIIDIWKEHKDIVEDLPSIRKYKFKASVNIMYGCNNFCTYCIVPYVRGRERSREVDDILNEIKDLVNDGVKEVMLLGQNVNSYGKTLKDKTTFSELLRKVNEIEGLKRIRFMTSHPKDLSDELIKTIKECDKVCKSLHLPFQAGSTKILEKMNRKYSKEQYLELATKIQKEIPDITLTTDIIVGFPGETEQDFEDTLDIVRKIRFNGAFTFLYSKRTGTPAATMEEQVDEKIATKRFNKLQEVLIPIITEKNKAMLGKKVEILVEGRSKNHKEFLTGRTEGGHLVHFKGDSSLVGEFVNVEIIEPKTFYLIGKIC